VVEPVKAAGKADQTVVFGTEGILDAGAAMPSTSFLPAVSSSAQC